MAVEATNTPWGALAQAAEQGLPVPEGFLVYPETPEKEVRAKYEDLKIHTKTHFVAVRSPAHAVVNLIGPDPLIHALRRLRIESPQGPIFVQQMIYSSWCGKAQRHSGKLHIEANEGMMIFNPDTYVLSAEDGKCLERGPGRHGHQPAAGQRRDHSVAGPLRAAVLYIHAP